MLTITNDAGFVLRTVGVDPDFDLVSALKLSIDTEAKIASALRSDDSDLLALSPLTSLEATPTNSPPRAASPDSIPTHQATQSPGAGTRPFSSDIAEAVCSSLQTHLLTSASTSCPSVAPSLHDHSMTTSSSSTGNSSKQQPSHARRARARARNKATDAVYIHYKVKPKIKARYLTEVEKLECAVDGLGKNHTSNAFTGLDDGTRSKRLYKLKELIGPSSTFKFTLVKWNGKTPYGLVDRKHRRLVGILAGVPRSSQGSPVSSHWPTLVEGVTNLMTVLRKKCKIVVKKKNGKKVLPRRGNFAALQSGVSHGGGQLKPSNVANLPANASIVEELNRNEWIGRVAGFQSSVMALWAPELHNYYNTYVGQLLSRDTTLRRNFSNSVFPMVTYNLGPRTTCYKHTDFANLPFGLCAITPFGNYDPEQGGHLVLWEYKLVIEFPPGSTILIPSGVVAHSNVPVGSDETRYSMVQYAAGALFRWVDHGFMATEDYLNQLSEPEREEHDRVDSERWKFGLSLLPTFKDKEQDDK